MVTLHWLSKEVEAQTSLGKEAAKIMAQGDLVSSAVVVRRQMRQHPGQRILLDGFPRSLENAMMPSSLKKSKDAERAANEGKHLVYYHWL